MSRYFFFHISLQLAGDISMYLQNNIDEPKSDIHSKSTIYFLIINTKRNTSTIISTVNETL